MISSTKRRLARGIGAGLAAVAAFGTLGVSAASASRINQNTAPTNASGQVQDCYSSQNAGTVTIIAMVTNPRSGGSSYFLN